MSKLILYLFFCIFLNLKLYFEALYISIYPDSLLLLNGYTVSIIGLSSSTLMKAKVIEVLYDLFYLVFLFHFTHL